MVGQGGTDHARRRTLSIPVGPEVTMDREPCEPGCPGQRVDVWAEHSDTISRVESLPLVL